MLIKTAKLHQAPGIHRFQCKTSLILKNCNIVHIFYMDSLDNLDIFCPYDLCCSFSNHEKSSHNTVLDSFGHAYLCDSHTSQKLQHKHTFFVKCAAQVYHRKPGRTHRRTDGRQLDSHPISSQNGSGELINATINLLKTERKHTKTKHFENQDFNFV